MHLSRGARHCLKTLQTFFCGKKTCWPRRETIAGEMGCTVRQVARYLAELRTENVLSVRRRPNSSSVYTLQAEMSSPMSSPDVLSVNVFTEAKEVNLTRKPPQTAANAATPAQTWADMEAEVERELAASRARYIAAYGDRGGAVVRMAG
jgi:hypothetical protein